MASDQTISTHDQTIKPLCGGSEETNIESCRGRGRRVHNGKGPKRQPQRGLGVAELERLRIQESLNKINETTSGLLPTLPHQLLRSRPPTLPFIVHDPLDRSSGVPVRYGAGPNHGHGAFRQCPLPVNNGNTIVNRGGFNVAGGGDCPCSGIGGWVMPNQVPRWRPLVGIPLEISKELSSMPNVPSESECCDVCQKKKRFNVKGYSNASRDRPSEIWSIKGTDFLGFTPQQSPVLVGETSDFYTRPVRNVADSSYSTRNLDEVVAVHRKGNSESGRVFMEYEFLLGKDDRGTTSKLLELPTKASAAVGSEASSSITGTAYGGPTASNSIDLSLKL